MRIIAKPAVEFPKIVVFIESLVILNSLLNKQGGLLLRITLKPTWSFIREFRVVETVLYGGN